jgi:hypothetical protein
MKDKGINRESCSSLVSPTLSGGLRSLRGGQCRRIAVADIARETGLSGEAGHRVRLLDTQQQDRETAQDPK